ncbi:MAG TPA: RIP metalloprotease RseP [Myxococcota bacterium]|nr:RIP metalloprotease RseP [Myxococcota bacterium]
MSWLANVVNWVLPFMLVLGVLVTLHELGHFLAARACGVRVLKFSIGFGSAIGFGRWRLRWLRNGTEFVVAWIPLGGYVKMLGENLDEQDGPAARADRAHSLPAASLWRKLTIVLAGPAMNLALPVAVFLGLLWVGAPREAAVVGSVERGSPAEAAGLRPGDGVVAVDGRPVHGWSDVQAAVQARPGSAVRLTIERGDAAQELAVRAETRSGFDIAGIPGDVGWIGAHHERQLAVVAVASPESAAARAGLRSGDRIVAVNGEPSEEWFAFEAKYAAAQGDAVLRVARGQPPVESDVRVPALGSADALGVSTAVVVTEVTPDSPAAKAGILPGDVLVAIDGHAVGSFQTFMDTVRGSKGRTLAIELTRAGATKKLSVTPAKLRTELAPGLFEDVYRVGIAANVGLARGAMVIERVRNPLIALPRAVQLTANEMRRFFAGLGHMVSGRIGRDAIGGPIEIARQSKVAWDLGWPYFIQLFVLISINLGILNLLPIPVLDGGQAVIYTLEAALRDRFTLRAREIAQTVGLALLMTLMVFALYNDITKHVVGFFRNL